MRFYLFIIVFFYYLVSNLTLANERIHNILPNFETYIKKTLQDWDAPGVAVAIVKDGQVVYQKGFGVTEVGSSQPVNEHTVFQIASLSKIFLATLYAQFVDEGKLSFDDPVLKYLSDFVLSDPEITKQFTIRDLLSHRSGLKHFSGDTFWYVGANSDEICTFLSKLPFTATFRKTYGYQNHMFGVAGLIAEKITGQTIKELYTTHFFEPLGMNDSSVGLEAVDLNPKQTLWQRIKSFFYKETPKNVAVPHHMIDGKVTALPINAQMYTFSGSTGVNTSAADMAKWMLFHLNNGKVNGKQLVSIANEQELRKPEVSATDLRPDDPQFPAKQIQNVKYGMGWFLYDFVAGNKKVPMIAHMGGFAGIRSLIVLVPSENLGLVFLSNFGAMRVSMLPDALRARFFDLYYDLPETDWSVSFLQRMQEIRAKNKQYKVNYRLQNPRAAQPLEKYIGEFENDLYGKLKLAVKDNQLWLHYRDKVVPLKHWNGDEFSFKGNDLTPVYSSYDEGYIEFGFQKSINQADLCVVNLLSEGKDDLFKRVE